MTAISAFPPLYVTTTVGANLLAIMRGTSNEFRKAETVLVFVTRHSLLVTQRVRGPRDRSMAAL